MSVPEATRGALLKADRVSQPAYVSVREAARVLGVGEESLRRALAAGRFPGKLAARGQWRIAVSTLHEWGRR